MKYPFPETGDYASFLLHSASLPNRVWNGIFAAGDRRLKRDLKSMSPRRDRKLETTTREKSPEKKRLFY